MTQEVTDRPAEVGIKLNNILTALVLMVMSWVGWNISEIRKDIVTLTAASAVNAVRIEQNSKDISAVRGRVGILERRAFQRAKP